MEEEAEGEEEEEEDSNEEEVEELVNNLYLFNTSGVFPISGVPKIPG